MKSRKAFNVWWNKEEWAETKKKFLSAAAFEDYWSTNFVVIQERRIDAALTEMHDDDYLGKKMNVQGTNATCTIRSSECRNAE